MKLIKYNLFLIIALVMSHQVYGQVNMQNLLKSKTWFYNFGTTSSRQYEFTSGKMRVTNNSSTQTYIDYYLSNTYVDPSDFDASKVGVNTGGRFIITRDYCYQISGLSIDLKKFKLREVTNAKEMLLVANNGMASYLHGHLTQVSLTTVSVAPLREIINELTSLEFRDLIKCFSTSASYAYWQSKVGIVEEGDNDYDNIVLCTIHIRNRIYDYLYSKEGYENIIFEGCKPDDSCGSSTCKGYIAALPDRCTGDTWETTHGYFGTYSEAFYSGDCDDNDVTGICGDGTFACSQSECYPKTIAISTAGLTKEQCETQEGATWVRSNIEVLGSCTFE